MNSQKSIPHSDENEALRQKVADLQVQIEELQQQEVRFQQMYEHTSIGIAELDLEFAIKSANAAYCEMLGYTEEELIGKTIPEITHPEDQPENTEKLAQLAGGEIPMFQMEKRFIHKKGQTVYGLVNATVIRDSKDNPAFLLGNVLDITSQKKMESSLQVGEIRYQSLFNSIRDAILVANTDREIIDCNPAFTDLFEYSLEEIKGKKIKYVYADTEDYEQMDAQLRKHLDDRKFQMVIHYKKKTGETFPGETSAFYLQEPGGEVAGFIGLIRDISGRLEQQKALEKSEHKFREIFHNTQDVLFLQRRGENPLQQGFLEVNRTAQHLLGYSYDELMEMTPGDFVNMPEDEAQQVRNEYNANKTVSFETTITTKGGQEIPVEMRDHHFTLDSEAVVLSVVKDISNRKKAEEERKQYEAQLRQAQKMEAVGRLAGGIAHDFNNKLTVILGQADLALTTNPPDKMKETLETIKKSAQESADLTSKLLGFARKQPIDPHIIDLNETVSAMLSMLKKLIGENINLAWIPAGNVWPVKLDPAQVDQLLANLLVNARDAIDDVGKVTIETANVTFDEEYCRTHHGFELGDYVMVAVSDDGCGMDEDTLSDIFEPFFTTKSKEKGTGLGLATVYGIVKQNNGFINVYSEPGEGTTFKIYLPKEGGEAEPVTRQRESDLVQGGSETIIVVEDDPDILHLAQVTLERWGYSVFTANSAQEALRLAEKQVKDIHLVITDVVMPEMNGRELAASILSISPQIKILFMSGYTENGIVHQSILEDQVEFIQKPYSPVTLARKVREVLDG